MVGEQLSRPESCDNSDTWFLLVLESIAIIEEVETWEGEQNTDLPLGFLVLCPLTSLSLFAQL